MRDAPCVSIIIPSHNRVKSLMSALERLRSQTFPASRFEVIVVADDCSDGTAETVTAFDAPFRLSVVEKALRRAARARNAGARDATGNLLLFLDDDVLPTVGLVSAHVELHRQAPCQPAVVSGYYPTKITFQQGFYAVSLAVWWEDKFQAMAAPSCRFSFTDVLTGNLSLPRHLFEKVGGFDEDLPMQEDYELGYRLIETGAAIYFSRSTLGEHVETSDLKRSVGRKHVEGVSDVRLWRRHPELAPLLSFVRARLCAPARLGRFFAFHSASGSRVFEGAIMLGMEVAERMKLRNRWLHGCSLLFNSAYWRGVASELGSPTAFRAIVADRDEPKQDDLYEPLDLDVSEGIAAAEARLNAARPRSFTVRLGSVRIGHEPARLGAERLHAGHLRPMLARHFAHDLSVASGIAGLDALGLPSADRNGSAAASASIAAPGVDHPDPHSGFESALAER